MKNVQKRSVIAAIEVCAGAAIMAGVVSKQPEKEAAFRLPEKQTDAEEQQPGAETDPYDAAETDILKIGRNHCRQLLIIRMRMNRVKMWNTYWSGM